jgi:16S rRNA (adenine1518-N6/adenine1519-N6)-dimethyltransferase
MPYCLIRDTVADASGRIADLGNGVRGKATSTRYLPASWYDATSQKHGESKIQSQKSKIASHRPKLGQHFLHDQSYRNRILEELDLNAHDLVIEIGPGRGAMTGLLAGRARKVIAIQIILADILRVDFGALCRQEGISEAFVFGNLPYYITSPILHKLFAQRNFIRSMGLLMQREVAERLTAEPGSRDYGYLTVATQIFSQPRIAVRVPPGAFSPAPQVQSALVTFRMNAKFDQWPRDKAGEFLEFVKRCFAQKRKNLLNNLGGVYPRTHLLKALEALGKPASLRAEELSLDAFAAFFEELTRAG